MYGRILAMIRNKKKERVNESGKFMQKAQFNLQPLCLRVPILKSIIQGNAAESLAGLVVQSSTRTT